MTGVLDQWLKFTGTKAQAKAAIETLGLTEILQRDDNGVLQIGDVFTHDVALLFHKNLMTAFGTETTPPVFSGPHLMIRFISKRAKLRAKEKIIDAGGLPADIDRVTAPVTIEWFGG